LTHLPVADNANYLVDTTAPVFSSATTLSLTDSGSGINPATSVYTAAATDAGGGSVTYALNGGLDANLFNIHSTTGVVTFKTLETYLNPHDSGSNHVYDFNVSALDAAGNSATISGLKLFIPTKIQFETIAAHHPGNLLHDVTTLSDSTFFTSTSTPNDLDLWGFAPKSNLIYTVDKAYWNDSDPSSAFPHLGQVIVGVL